MGLPAGRLQSMTPRSQVPHRSSLGHHSTSGEGRPRDPHEIVVAHVRRLEALRRASIVEREAQGVWRIPADPAKRGCQYYEQRLGGVVVEVKSHLSIERQARVIGATWLEQQLIGGGEGLGELRFGGEVKEALRQRAAFLIEQGLAEHRGPFQPCTFMQRC